jgi:hypothetical protein
MMRLILPLLFLSSCQARTFDCGVVDVEVTRVLVVDEYPDVAEVFDRMDIFCKDSTDTFQTCAAAGYEHTESCTRGIGLGPHRGRMYADKNADETLTELVMHEAQHWHLMLVNSDEGCPTHDAACGWSE